MSEYKKSAEWQALNRIWKKCGVECQNICKTDFELLATFIHEHVAKTMGETNSHGSYLNKFSDDAKNLIENSTPNVYHSIMAVLGSRKFDSLDVFAEYYKKKYSNRRPEVFENEKVIYEIIEKCWETFNRRRK